jgi:hypothetical protein
MKELGEDPAAFEQFSESLRKALCPQDGFEQMLVEDMAEIRWRRQRLMRAEAGIMATKRREFEIEREWKVANYGKGFSGAANDVLCHDMGLSALRPSDENFAQILEFLEVLRHLVETEGFREEDSRMLTMVYGKTPSYTGRYLTSMFKRGQEGAKDESGQDSGEVEGTRRVFLETLTREIASYLKLAELMDSQLIPSQEDLRKIMDYEAALERQFERKLQQLVAWRRAKGEVDTSSSVIKNG